MTGTPSSRRRSWPRGEDKKTTMNIRLQSVIVLVIAALVLLSGMPVSAGDRARQEEPVTLYFAGPVSSITLDPQACHRWRVNWYHEKLFLGLTYYHPVTGEIVQNWRQAGRSARDGRSWTFHLRDDVPWVRWDPVNANQHSHPLVTAHDAE